MKKKKLLIDLTQDNLIQCDNESCDYVIPNPTKDPNAPISQYIDMPCPMCGENLLTQEDYNLSVRFHKIVDWLNKWFSWLTIFSFSKDKGKNASVHVHKGIKIDKIK